MDRTVGKIAVGVSIAVLIGAALYLYAVRGQAMLLDLSAMAGRFICF